MKNFLQNLLIFFALCLCALIAIQWVRETDLNRRVQALSNLNTVSKTISDIATRWGKMAEDYGKAKPDAQREMAANNMNQMTKDFNDLVTKWNEMQQELQRSNSNPPASPTNAPPPGTK